MALVTSYFCGGFAGSLAINMLAIIWTHDVESAGFLPVIAAFWFAVMMAASLALVGALILARRAGRFIRKNPSSRAFATTLIGMCALELILFVLAPDHSLDLSAGKGTVVFMMLLGLPIFISRRFTCRVQP